MRKFADNGDGSRSPWYLHGGIVLGYAVLAIAAVVIAGWIFEPVFFKRLVASLDQTKPNTAVGFFLLSSALLMLDSSHRQLRLTSRFCAAGATLIGALTSVECVTGRNLHIDQLLFYAHSGSSMHPSRMALVTSFNMTFLGLAILLVDFRRGRFWPTTILTWVTAVLSSLALAGNAYDPARLYQLRIIPSASLLTSLTFLLLCAAIMYARPDRGVAKIVLSQDLGGKAARHLLPIAIFIPFCVSLLILRMYQSGTYGPALMVFLFVVAPVVIFVPLVLVSASLLSRMELERKQSEEKLRISTLRFSSVVASAMDAIITLDENFNVIVFNEAAEKMFGCPSWEVMGKQLDRFLPVEFREHHNKQIRHFGQAGITTRSMTSPGVLTALRANGEKFPIEATISQVEVVGQRLYTVILRDITARKQAEETLRESEARFRSIYEQASVGIAQIAPDGQFLVVNAALCRMLGYKENELLGKKVGDVIHPEDKAREGFMLTEMQRGYRRYEMEKRYLHRDGSAVWVHVSSSMVSDSNGAPLYRISVVQNMTERKRAEEQLKQAQKMEAIGRLAGGVAHDFNTLLNVMLGYSELLLSEMPSDDPRREKVALIKSSGEAGAMLTKQLLAFSRKQAVAQEVLDLREVASKMIPILGRLLRDDIELTVKCADDVCPVKVDPGQIQQLVLNLVANAGDAMPAGGHLDIEVKAVNADEAYVMQHPTMHVGPYAMLAIHDSGTGMDADTVAHIFEPFFTTKEAGKGTGLGLATVYGIAKRNGGDIWVYSEPGSGTTFKVFLPLTQEALQRQESVAVHPGDALEGGETVLLVEDSAALRELTKVILLRNGFQVLEAEDGIAALEVSNSYSGTIHLLLTDVVMPRMRGPHLAKEILKQRPEISVVFLSGYTEEVISQSDGITGFTLIEKPYTGETLMRSLRRALNSRVSKAISKAHT